MKVLCVHMNVILYRPKSVRLSRYPLFTLRSELIAGSLTLRPLLQRLAWSLNLAFDGVGSLGEKLCPDGERFVVAEFRGDQEFHRKLWQHKAHWNSHCPCFKCHASTVDPKLFVYRFFRQSWLVANRAQQCGNHQRGAA